MHPVSGLTAKRCAHVAMKMAEYGTRPASRHKLIQIALATVAITLWTGWQTPAVAQEMRPMPSQTQAPPTKTRQTYYMFVLNQPKPGRDADFNRWYDEHHAQDVLVNPEYLESQRFIVNEQQLRPGTTAPAQYLIAFKIVTKDIGHAFQYIHNNLRSGKTVPTDSIAPGTVSGGDFSYRAVTPQHTGRAAAKRAAQDFSKRYLQIEFSTVTAGEETAFSRWHDKTHAPKVAALAQVRHWQRFELSPVQLTASKLPIATRYMTLYELDIATPAEFEQLQRDLETIVAGDTARPGNSAYSLTYRAIGPVLLGSDVKKERGVR